MLWIFVRHGESEYSKEGIYTGMTDVPLTDYGYWQAVETGKWLGANYEPDHIWVSPRIRTQQTLRGLLEGAQLSTHPDPVTEDRLREISYGKWEGLTRDQILASDGAHYRNWEREPALLRAGHTGETEPEVRTRVLDALRNCTQGTYWFVTHRTVMRTMMAALVGLPLNVYRARFEQGHASINIFSVTEASHGSHQLLAANLMPWMFAAADTSTAQDP